MRRKKVFLILAAFTMVTMTVVSAFGQGECCAGKVTGGGIFSCKCAGDKITFGFNIVRQPGENVIKGKLEYHDHTLGLNVHAHDFSELCVSLDGRNATFAGTCTINAEEGFTFIAYVEDNGQPGRNDVFELELFNMTGPWDYSGYHSVGNPIRGGNIRIHWALPD